MAEDKITVTIDGFTIKAKERETILSIARRYNIDIPTLCHCDELEPSATCRVCLCEISSGQDYRKLVTACNYPVWDGITIKTQTDQIIRYRKMCLEALLGRSPEVKAIRELAQKYDVTKSRFLAKKDSCILCGLCTRVCESYATNAIAMQYRGNECLVAPHLQQDTSAPDCVGCLACEEICPTEHIKAKPDSSGFTIWGRKFELPSCRVDPEACIGCGVCEESCPFQIPRVVLSLNGAPYAKINPANCKGCQVCVAACPTNAINSPNAKKIPPLTGVQKQKGILVLACLRADISRINVPEAQSQSVDIAALDCVGAVSRSMLLGALAQGYKGVLVVGRHPQSCRIGEAESWAKSIAVQTSRVARLVGLGADRIRFVDHREGIGGFWNLVKGWEGTLKPNPLKTYYTPKDHGEGLDAELKVVNWLLKAIPQEDSCSYLHKKLPSRYQNTSLTPDRPGEPVLLSLPIHYFDLLLSNILPNGIFEAILIDILKVLSACGINPKVKFTDIFYSDINKENQSDNALFYVGCRKSSQRLLNEGFDAIFLEQIILKNIGLFQWQGEKARFAVSKEDYHAESFLTALGIEVVELPPFSLPEDTLLAISRSQRTALENRLLMADSLGATHMLVGDPFELAWHQILQRSGSWVRSKVKPTMLAKVAAYALK